jgi:branched-chain amino acid transport system ATP-binding protein
MKLLTVSGLNAYYGDFQALYEVSLEAGEGEAIAVIGANGAGKSTLLNAIAGNLASRGDAISFAGEGICGLPPWQIVARGIALVPEGRRLFRSLTVEENLRMGAYSRSREAHTLDEIYEIFPQLRLRARQSALLLSGGEQQMVAIGRALISRPRLLMCDELSLGLAPKIVSEIYETLGLIRKRGVTLIIVEQNVRQAMAFADRVYCLQEGRVSLEGISSQLHPDQVSRAYFGLEGRA